MLKPQTEASLEQKQEIVKNSAKLNIEASFFEICTLVQTCLLFKVFPIKYEW